MKNKKFALIGLLSILLVSGLSCIGGSATKYLLTTVVDGQGSVTPSEGSFAPGEAVTLTASPASGWYFSHWGGQGSGSQNPITITMDTNKMVYAYFMETPIETPWPTYTPALELPYNTVKPQIQNAIISYMVENNGELPPYQGTITINFEYYGEIECRIFDICAVVGDQMLLRYAPDGCYGNPGEANTNFYSGACINPTSGHYIWVIDIAGNVYSTCVGADCDANNADGFQGVWP